MRHILVIHPRYCVRAQKQIEGLLDRGGIRITLVTDLKKYGYRISEKVWSHATIYSLKFRNRTIARYRFKKLLRKILPAVDLIHCHNEPNYHVGVVLSLTGKRVPVIYDIHDFTSMRSGRPDEDERYAYLNANAIVHVGDSFIEYGEEIYGKRNCHTIMSVPSRRFIHDHIKDIKNEGPFQFVYQGHILDSTFSKKELFVYRDYMQIFRSMLDEGHTVHVYPAEDVTKLPGYVELDANHPRFHLHERLPYSELLEELHRYDFGIAGFNIPELLGESTRRFLMGAMGNKLFDYLFAGIPVVVLSAGSMADFVAQHKCGVQKAENKTWSECIGSASYTDNIPALAREFCMERQIDKLIGIYDSLWASKPKGALVTSDGCFPGQEN